MNISEDRIHTGLMRNEFIPVYQSLIDVHTKEIVGEKNLNHWATPEDGVINVVSFINNVTEFGLINEQTNILMDKVITEFNTYKAVIHK